MSETAAAASLPADKVPPNSPQPLDDIDMLDRIGERLGHEKVDKSPLIIEVDQVDSIEHRILLHVETDRRLDMTMSGTLDFEAHRYFGLPWTREMNEH